MPRHDVVVTFPSFAKTIRPWKRGNVTIVSSASSLCSRKAHVKNSRSRAEMKISNAPTCFCAGFCRRFCQSKSWPAIDALIFNLFIIADHHHVSEVRKLACYRRQAGALCLHTLRRIWSSQNLNLGWESAAAACAAACLRATCITT